MGCDSVTRCTICGVMTENVFAGKCDDCLREYVIICTEHNSFIPGALLFWGSRTPDNAARRSFGGYTAYSNKCERYGRLDIQRETSHRFKFYGEDFEKKDWRKQLDFAIKVSQIPELGYEEFHGYIRS